eukprot:TRINITY_DN4635_c0_g1_i1.p1 TRINITY_DN4635_c0_g1~~TRINITY_DN4635_c0_g1_i1.p1  ORF type:complete len:449 (+),score=50.96 TRINITY_DN4635_c0_g1_i1:45-1349(+)
MNPIKRFSYFITLLTILQLTSLTHTLNTHVQSALNTSDGYYETLGTFPYHFSSDMSEVVEREVYGEVLEACLEEGYVGVSGMVVLVYDQEGCWTTDKVHLAYQAGAAGVGVIEDYAGSRYNYYYPLHKGDEYMPVFSVSESDAQRWDNYRNANISVFLTLERIENPYQTLYESAGFLIVQVVMILFFTLYAIYVFWKLVNTVQNMGVVNIVFICLVIELVLSVIVKIVFWIDPNGSRRLFSLVVSRTLFSISSDSPTVVVQILLSLFWMETIKAVGKYKLISPLSVGIVLTVGILLFGLALLSAWAIFLPDIDSLLSSISGGCITVILLGATIFYIVIVIKLWRYANRINSQIKRDKANNSMKWFLASGILCVLFIIVSILIIWLIRTPETYILWYVCIHLILWGMSFTKVYPINVGSKDTGSTGTGATQKATQ